METYEAAEKLDDGNLVDNPAKASNDIPDGTLRGWLVCGAGATIMAMSFGMVNSFGIYQTYYETKYPQISSETLSVIGALQASLTYFTALPSTVGMYYVGPQAMVFVGGLTACLSFMFLSITNAPWQIFVVQGLMFGLGSGLMYTHAQSVLFQYFDKKKAVVSGLITGGSSAAGVYWPIAVRKLFDLVGFGWTNRIIGFLYLPMFIGATMLLRPRVPPQKRKPGQNILRLNFRVLLDWKFQLVNTANLIGVTGLFPGLFYLDLFCQRLPINAQFQQYNVAITNSSAMVGRILPGWLGDKVGRINIVIPMQLVSGILPFALWMHARTTGTVAAFCVVWGFTTGVSVSVIPAIIGQLFPAQDMPSYLAIFFATSGIGSLVGPIVGGLFIPRGEVSGATGFNRLAIFIGVLFFGSTAFLVVVRLVYTRGLLVRL